MSQELVFPYKGTYRVDITMFPIYYRTSGTGLANGTPSGTLQVWLDGVQIGTVAGYNTNGTAAVSFNIQNLYYTAGAKTLELRCTGGNTGVLISSVSVTGVSDPTPPKSAATPVLTGSNDDAVAVNVAANLTVSVTNPEQCEVLTYQWYSNSTASTIGGTLITGAESATYKPINGTPGTYYYYCVVTNEISDADPTGNATASATSNVGTVVVTGESEPIEAIPFIHNTLGELKVGEEKAFEYEGNGGAISWAVIGNGFTDIVGSSVGDTVTLEGLAAGTTARLFVFEDGVVVGIMKIIVSDNSTWGTLLYLDILESNGVEIANRGAFTYHAVVNPSFAEENAGELEKFTWSITPAGHANLSITGSDGEVTVTNETSSTANVTMIITLSYDGKSSARSGYLAKYEPPEIPPTLKIKQGSGYVIDYAGFIDYEALFTGMTGSDVSWSVSSGYAVLSSETGGTVRMTNNNDTGVAIGVIITATYSQGGVTITDRRSLTLNSMAIPEPPVPASLRIKQGNGYVLDFGTNITYEAVFGGMTGSEITWTVSSGYAILSSTTGGTVIVTNNNDTGATIGVIITATYSQGGVTITDRKSFSINSLDIPEPPAPPSPPVQPTLGVRQGSGYVINYGGGITFDAVGTGINPSEIVWSVSSSYAGLSGTTGASVTVTNNNTSGMEVSVIITASCEGLSVSRSFKLLPE